MRKKIVAGNWKMNTTLSDALQLVNGILHQSKNPGVEKIIFPPFTFLRSVQELLNGHDGFFMGAQNCSEYDKGAYTGEVSATMLKSVGCEYVLVGHSERRQYFNEDARQLRAKMERALEHGIKIIFCFGEQLSERKNNLHFETVKMQLRDVLKDFPEHHADRLVLAYEPVWAIGTGETATPAQAQEMHAFVRENISTIFSDKVAAEIPILYGGSCNAQNARELFSCKDLDGGLIGGASLKADDFCKIINSF